MALVSASIITIGDELLIGQVIDTNSAWIAQQLLDLGIEIIRRTAIGDDKNAIMDTLSKDLQAVQLVILTGGLGPTSDDITKPALCEYFNSKLVVNKKVESHLRSLFERRNIPLFPANLSQAEVPENCLVLFNRQGTAPGMLFEKNNSIIISLPGVPHEMKGIMEDEVIPMLRKRFSSDAFMYRTIMTAGFGETAIAEKIKDIEEKLPSHIRLAYLPAYRMVRLRLTGSGADKNILNEELKKLQEAIANRLNEMVVSLEDLPLEQIIISKLTKENQTIALAESCTGGYIGHRITQIHGASKCFLGSIVCYQYSAKELLLGVDATVLKNQGAVCEEVAKQMAIGVRKSLKSHIGFGITGLLSAGGDDDKTPVGTVWMAVCDESAVRTIKYNFPYDRIQNKEVAANMALLFIWKYINHFL
ncbi:MAG: CinA family nicotinamide mononucleotide deamidase-related protein [Bacteroidetes bacterium]|nr:CinA family nicotinamide mononucleotide deamidase-related protein [Bacteroidota bacterium]MBS1738923.1 CinA family nicotinamide mononucleotide deamidase-related protein [Bacteroidota bacterium]